jgi:hypothetical protein
MKRDIVMCWASSVLRMFMCGLALISGYIALAEPRSLAFLAAARSSDGYNLTLALSAFAIVGLLDVVINDLLPDQVQWATSRNLRHFGYCSMAFCYIAQLFVAHAAVRSPGLTAYYLWNAGTIMFVVFWDANLRSKDATCKLACN